MLAIQSLNDINSLIDRQPGLYTRTQQQGVACSVGRPTSVWYSRYISCFFLFFSDRQDEKITAIAHQVHAQYCTLSGRRKSSAIREREST